VTTAVWFGNVSGKYNLNRYPGGINNRHVIAKPINAAANTLYPGGTFDAPDPALVSTPVPGPVPTVADPTAGDQGPG